MYKRLMSVLAVGAGLLAPPAWAASYVFDVQYNGNGNASLAIGSDDPMAITLWDGDSFDWTISAQDDRYWEVVTGGDFFPLQALGVAESGTRIGDLTLTLLNDGVPVYTESATDVVNNFVHVGTNTITLATGLVFDQMRLQYTLTTGIEATDYAADPDNLLPIGSSPTGLLPILGAPEMNTVFPGIVYAPVPEPATWALWLAGGAWLAGRARRRRD